MRSKAPRRDEPIDPEQPTAAMTAAAPSYEEIDLLRRALDVLKGESRTVQALFAVEGLTRGPDDHTAT